MNFQWDAFQHRTCNVLKVTLICNSSVIAITYQSENKHPPGPSIKSDHEQRSVSCFLPCVTNFLLFTDKVIWSFFLSFFSSGFLALSLAGMQIKTKVPKFYNCKTRAFHILFKIFTFDHGQSLGTVLCNSLSSSMYTNYKNNNNTNKTTSTTTDIIQIIIVILRRPHNMHRWKYHRVIDQCL